MADHGRCGFKVKRLKLGKGRRWEDGRRSHGRGTGAAEPLPGFVFGLEFVVWFDGEEDGAGGDYERDDVIHFADGREKIEHKAQGKNVDEGAEERALGPQGDFGVPTDVVEHEDFFHDPAHRGLDGPDWPERLLRSMGLHTDIRKRVSSLEFRVSSLRTGTFTAKARKGDWRDKTSLRLSGKKIVYL
jgi:hypothetical protein